MGQTCQDLTSDQGAYNNVGSLVRPRSLNSLVRPRTVHPRTSSSNQPNLTWVICTGRFNCHGYQRLRKQSSHQGKPKVPPVPNFKAVSAICRPSQHGIKDLDGINTGWLQKVLTKRLNLLGFCYRQGPDISHRTLRKHLSWAFTLRPHQPPNPSGVAISPAY